MAQSGDKAPPRINADAEIVSLAQDRLGRAEYARRVADRITTAGDGPSVVFGLAGPWGSGKSSALRMIAEVLGQSPTAETWTVVRFAPWSATDLTTLTAEFYNAIASAMPRADKAGEKAASLLRSAVPLAAAVSKALLKAAIDDKVGEGATKDVVDAIADQVGDFTVGDAPFVTRFEKISAAIRAAGRNILVIVDDIDRLDADELLGVMKAVRLLGRFDRVHYLLAYDQDTVLDVLTSSALAAGKRARARQYLEKIVQYPFDLPPLQYRHFEREFSDALDAVTAVHGVGSQPLRTIINALPDAGIGALTVRNIHRLAAQVDVLLTLVGPDELEFVDAVLVTYVRLEYPAVYRLLSRWRDDLIGDVPEEPSPDTITESQWLSRVSNALLESTVGEERLHPQTHSVMDLLRAMFPRLDGESTSDRDGRHISRIDYFDRYFAFAVPVDDIPDSVVLREFRSLCETGQLPHRSAIAHALNNPAARPLVLRKVMRNLDVLQSASGAAFADAADTLTSTLYQRGRELGEWASVLYCLLAVAATRAAGEGAAGDVIRRFRNTFGLNAIVEVLTSRVDLAQIDPIKMARASWFVQAEVLHACEVDLTNDVGPDGPGTPSVLRLARYLDDAMWTRLARFAAELIARGALPWELAARFVVPGEPLGDVMYIETFERVVPRELWNLDEIPFDGGGAIVPGDASLENRARIACNFLRSEARDATAEDYLAGG